MEYHPYNPQNFEINWLTIYSRDRLIASRLTAKVALLQATLVHQRFSHTILQLSRKMQFRRSLVWNCNMPAHTIVSFSNIQLEIWMVLELGYSLKYMI